MKRIITLPVITLPSVVFFPDTVLPMTIQDKTCIQIIKDAVENGTLVALAMSKVPDDHMAYKATAKPNSICTAGVPHILEDNQEAGQLKIVLKGEGRIFLKQCVQQLPYPIFEAEIFPNDSQEAVFDSKEINKLRELMTLWLENFIQDSVEREQFMAHIGSVDKLLNNVSMLLVKDPDVKQILLENSSIAEKVKLLNSLFKTQTNFQENLSVANALIFYDNLEFQNLMPN